MSHEACFTQEDYRTLVNSLDRAVEVFELLGKSEVDAQAALKDFIENHWLKVWRGISY